MTHSLDSLIITKKEGQAPIEASSLPEGQSLRQLSPASTLALLGELAALLELVHQGGVVHRDLRPENVWVGNDGSLCLLNFMYAVRLGASETPLRPTALEYLAPEQIRAAGALYEPRSDLFSFGVILYEALTGQSPFAAKNSAAVLLAVLEKQPTAPRELSPLCSPEQEALCLRLLSKKPEDRPSIEEVMAQLSGDVPAKSSEVAPLQPTLPPVPIALADTVFPEREQSGSNKESSVPNRQVMMDGFGSAPTLDSSLSPKMPASKLLDKEMPTLQPEERYEVVEEFARGGLGRILRAYDRRLGRPVAMKEILRAGTGALEERFLREALITAKLEHPSIVPVHDLGRWNSGSPFYAMKLVSGRSFDKVIEEKKSFEERIALLPNAIAVCEAVAYAHAQRIIHRDLKPQNIMIGSFGETVVIDWGIAKDLNNAQPETEEQPAQPYQASLQEESLTKTGAILGTPAYMPLEQAKGKKVDERADVYSLGAILYQVLCGRPPYVRKRNIQVLAALIDGPPTPIQEKEPSTPKELAAIVEKAMAREAIDRYPTAQELADDLKRFQTGQLVGAHQYTATERLWKWIKQHRFQVIAASLLILTVIVAAIIDDMRVRDQQRATEKARKEAVERGEELDKQKTIVELQKKKSDEENQKLKLSQAMAWLDVDPLMTLSWLKSIDSSDPTQPWGFIRLIVAAAELRGVPTVLGESWSTPDCADGQMSNDIVFSPDGKILASGEEDGVIRLWDVNTKKCQRLKGHTSGVNKLVYSPDGKYLVSGGKDGAVILWDTTTWKGGTISKNEGEVKDVAFSEDSSLLAWGGAFPEVIIWDVHAASAFRTFRPAEGSIVWSVSFQPGGDLFSASVNVGVASLWSMRDGEVYAEVRPEFVNGEAASTVRFSFDGKLLALFGENVAGVSLLEIDSKKLSTEKENQLTLHGGAFSSLGGHFAAIDVDGHISLWNLAEGISDLSRISIQGHSSMGRSLAFSPDGQTLISSSEDRTVRLWSLRGEPLRVLRGPSVGVKKVVFSPDGSKVAACSGKALYLWQSSIPERLSGHTKDIWDLSFSSDGKWLVSAGFDKKLMLWKMDSLRAPPAVFSAPQTSLFFGAAFSPDGYWLAASNEDNSLYLRSLDGQVTRLLHTFNSSPTGLVFSPDSEKLLIGTMDGTVSLWNIHTGKLLKEMRTPEAPEEIYDIAWISGEKRAVSVSGNGMIRLWDLEAGGVVPGRFVKTAIPFLHVATSPEGRYAVAVGDSSTVILWDLEQNKSWELTEHQGVVYGVSFLSDGHGFVTSGSEGVLRLWDVSSKNSVLVPLGMGAYSVDVNQNETQLALSTAVGTEFALWINTLRLVSKKEIVGWLSSQTLPTPKTF